MAVFNTILHPTDFDEPSREAFRMSRELAQAVGARVVVVHVVAPPAIVTEDGRVILDPRKPEPVDLWAEYRRLQAGSPKVPVHYAVLVGERASAWRMIEQKVREQGEGTLVVMGSHGRGWFGRLLWGSKAEEVVRDFPTPVLVVKAASALAVPAPREGAAAGA